MEYKLIKFTPLCLLALYVVKSAILGAGVSDAIIASFLTCLVGMTHLIDNIKLKSIMQADVTRLEEELAAQKAKLGTFDEDLKKAVNYVSNAKLQNSSGRSIR